MRELLLAANRSAGGGGSLYVEDVFSAYAYTGTGSSGLQLSTGIDYTKGALCWFKCRSTAESHWLFDSARGLTPGTNEPYLQTNLTAQDNNVYPSGLTAIASGSVTLNSNANLPGSINFSGASNVLWTFRRSPKFFDVVTYTGNGAASQAIPHALGIAPGMVTAKRRDAAGDWAVWHRSATGDLYLDTAAAQTGSFTQITATSGTTFSVSGNANINGATYVAYLWAHDTSATGIAQCGTFTTDASTNFSATLGWEPQYVLIKTAGAYGWCVFDTARGFVAAPTNTDPMLSPNTSAAEVSWSDIFAPNATGFSGSIGLANQQVFYLAIRRGPMRTPTVGTSVYNAIARTGTGAAASVTGVGFAPDLAIVGDRGGFFSSGGHFADKLRGASQRLVSANGNVESADANAITSFDPDGFSVGTDSGHGEVNATYQSQAYINWFFRRAPGFFDIVCYTCSGSTAQRVTHNLKVAPELVITKNRQNAYDWYTYVSALGTGKYLAIDTSSAPNAIANFWGTTLPTATDFGTDTSSFTVGSTQVAYLFASCPGVSSVGSYTGQGGFQPINCGFTTGARFVMIKRADSTGDWFVWDTVRGITTSPDPHLSLNTTVAEVTSDESVTPYVGGFGVAQNTTTNIDVNGATYIYFAVA